VIATDERHGLPSASKMHRIANCPPSHQMEQLCGPGKSNDEAASGTRIHAVLAGIAEPDTLDAGENETLDMCERQAKALVAEWSSGAESVTLLEKRLWLNKGLFITSDRHSGSRFSGQADMIVIEPEESRALVIDYKTGRGDQTEAVDNAQLASLAVLVANYTGVESVRVAIVQPWAGPPTIADYDEDALDQAGNWLRDKLRDAEHATPDQANPGPWCKYCRAAETLRCEAYRKSQETAIAPLQSADLAAMSPVDQRQALFERALELPADTLAGIIDKLAMLGRMIDAAKAAGKERAQSDPEFQAFYGIKEKAGIRKIRDVGAAFESASAMGVSAAHFTARCKLGLGDLRELLHNATGAKGRELESVLESVLAGNIEQGEPSIELKKK
jgi:RecB family exonuclease